MRKPSVLEALFTAPRRGILTVTLRDPSRWWYLSDLARHLRVHHASLQRELARLTAAGILTARKDGNRSYYRANSSSPTFPELRTLLIKTAGLIDVLKEALRPLSARITCAFVYGSVARSTEAAESDVDLMVIGDISLRELATPIRKAEAILQRPISLKPYRPNDFVGKLSSGSHFLEDVLQNEKLFVLGDQHDLDQLAQRGPSRKTQHSTQGNRRAAAGR